MRRLALTIALLLSSIHAAAIEEPGSGPVLRLAAEYRQDAIDYDDVEKTFFRETARLDFGASSARITHVHIGRTKENRFTWNILLRGISPHFDCIIGHYVLNFGAGLLAGRKRAVSPDLFSRRLVLSRSAPYTPCSSGNPLYSFRGAAAQISMDLRGVLISLCGFFSFRDRYARTDRYHNNYTGSSFNSILARTEKDYRYSEPAELYDYGCTLLLRLCEHFTLQPYFLYTALRRTNGAALTWSYGDHGVPMGEKGFYGYGIYLEYRDDYITIFCEAGFPRTIRSSIAGYTRTVGDYGILYGLEFRHPACAISFSGKGTGKNFYSPYSSGKRYAERAWMADIAVRPARGLSLGAGFFGEKQVAVNGYQTLRPFNRREHLFIKYGSPSEGSAMITFKCLEKETKNGIERTLRLAPSAKIFIMRSILLRASGAAQRDRSGNYSG
ncbi:MAG: hypothetical protein JW807_16575, partial [Spirochaetes bacterium]|nr:hypothetical protein [Spirochaetota bacterium]